MPDSTILAISLFFHLLATAIWVGGLLITTLLVWPEMRRVLENNTSLYSLLARLRKKFAPMSNLALAVLITTGLIQMSLDPNYDGFMTFDNTWSRVMLVKHIAIILMVIVGLILQNAVFPALERTTLLLERQKADSTTYEALRRREIRLTWVNVILGVCVLGFSAWAGSL
ncbi:MAG: CopD family protein [Anaerolineae bacterium]|nr:CopD family protein [Anaerolineae bacterium]